MLERGYLVVGQEQVAPAIFAEVQPIRLGEHRGLSARESEMAFGANAVAHDGDAAMALLYTTKKVGEHGSGHMLAQTFDNDAMFCRRSRVPQKRILKSEQALDDGSHSVVGFASLVPKPRCEL